MPEGQVSHRNAERLGAALAGRDLVEVTAPEPRLAPQRIPERLAGDRVTAAEAVGKHHLLRFASGRVLHSHLMMTGAWRLLPASRAPAGAGLFLTLRTEAHVAALYRCPRLRLLEPGAPLPASVARTGPDLIGEGVDPAAATAAALARVDPAREIGDALRDQRVVAGIGNVYMSETCFLAGIDPWRVVGTITEREAAALGSTGAELLAQGVRDGGRIRTRRAGRGRRDRDGATWVYGRAGRPCLRCGTPILARRQGDAARVTYWCPACQA
ncbi:MAG: DNA-formamidopyrimidine glycosylase family protein [Thermoleophilia bacterium]